MVVLVRVLRGHMPILLWLIPFPVCLNLVIQPQLMLILPPVLLPPQH